MTFAINGSNDRFTTPIIENHNASVCELVKAGTDVNISDHNGSTLLMGAAKQGCEACVDFLIQAGADVNICRIDGCSALIYAVMSNCHNCVRSLIEVGADVNVKCTSGDTPVILASRNINSADVLKLLVDAGADVNVVIRKGLRTITTLMLSAKRISNPTLLQQAKALLKAGARINMSGVNNHNALEMYITTCRWENRVPDKTMVLLLQAAGESFRTRHRIITSRLARRGTSRQLKKIKLASEISRTTAKSLGINLKNLSRGTIRNHLLHLNSHENLFQRAPRIGLPKILSQYLVYDICIDDDESSLI